MIALAIATALATAPLVDARELGGSDKVLHAGATCGVMLAGYGVAAAFDAPLWARLGAGIGAGVAVGAGKEAFDALGFGTPSLGDLLYDALGIGAGIGLALAIDAGALE